MLLRGPHPPALDAEVFSAPSFSCHQSGQGQGRYFLFLFGALTFSFGAAASRISRNRSDSGFPPFMLSLCSKSTPYFRNQQDACLITISR